MVVVVHMEKSLPNLVKGFPNWKMVLPFSLFSFGKSFSQIGKRFSQLKNGKNWKMVLPFSLFSVGKSFSQIGKRFSQLKMGKTEKWFCRFRCFIWEKYFPNWKKFFPSSSSFLKKKIFSKNPKRTNFDKSDEQLTFFHWWFFWNYSKIFVREHRKQLLILDFHGFDSWFSRLWFLIFRLWFLIFTAWSCWFCKSRSVSRSPA